MLTLPPIHEPQRYAGLFVYDFGTHVSVGYTAAEIRFLRESNAYAGGTVYEIYRVDDLGRIELRAVRAESLTAREAVCFLRRDGGAARRDFDMILEAADRNPVPCAVELHLSKLYDFDPPHVTAFSYTAAATTAVARWLCDHTADLGDRVIGGTEALATLASSGGVRIDSRRLEALLEYRDRSSDEVLRTVHEPLQR